MNMSDEQTHTIKSQPWFYEFKLPDGSTTASYLDPSFREIHPTRERMLRAVLADYHGPKTSALDVACHEGYYSLVLAEYFNAITGIDKNAQSIEKAALITGLLAPSKIVLRNLAVEDLAADDQYDFVLSFGLLYHHENPVGLIRRLSHLARHMLCIETQVTPVDISGAVEDGGCMNLRKIEGLFALCADYPHSAEGGMTDLAMIPSQSGLRFLLQHNGFRDVVFSPVLEGDYEQFRRGQRVVVTAIR